MVLLAAAAAALSVAMTVTMAFTAAALVLRIIMTFAPAAFVVGVIVAASATAFVFFFMFVPATTAATAVPMTMLVTMIATALGYANGFQLATFELSNRFFDNSGLRAVDCDALIEQIAQRHAIDAGAQNGVNRGAFLFGFFVNRNRHDGSGFSVENDQVAGIGKVRFSGRLQAVGFLGWNAELHGVSLELD